MYTQNAQTIQAIQRAQAFRAGMRACKHLVHLCAALAYFQGLATFKVRAYIV